MLSTSSTAPELTVKKCIFHFYPKDDLMLEKLSNTLEMRLRHNGCSKQHTLKPHFNIVTLGKILRIRQNSTNTSLRSFDSRGTEYSFYDNLSKTDSLLNATKSFPRKQSLISDTRSITESKISWADEMKLSKNLSNTKFYLDSKKINNDRKFSNLKTFVETKSSLETCPKETAEKKKSIFSFSNFAYNGKNFLSIVFLKMFQPLEFGTRYMAHITC